MFAGVPSKASVASGRRNNARTVLVSPIPTNDYKHMALLVGVQRVSRPIPGQDQDAAIPFMRIAGRRVMA
jgi:hypothetical protein